jgi:transposase-like protein
MNTGKFSDDFKRDAVAQVAEWGYPVKEVSERLGVSLHSLYAWKQKFGKASPGEAEKDVEIRRLKRELARATEERGILKKGRPRISPRMQSEICVRGRASRTVFRSGDVPLPAASAERILRLAENPAERTSPRRRTPDRAVLESLGREQQGLWLSQAA